MTYQEAIAIIEGWKKIPALNLAPGVEFCPADGTPLGVVEDIEGQDDHRCVLAGLYTCHKCGWVYYQAYEWEVIKRDPEPTSETEKLRDKVRKMAKEHARACPRCFQPVTFGDEWHGECPHCHWPLLSLATPPPGWDKED